MSGDRGDALSVNGPLSLNGLAGSMRGILDAFLAGELPWDRTLKLMRPLAAAHERGQRDAGWFAKVAREYERLGTALPDVKQ